MKKIIDLFPVGNILIALMVFIAIYMAILVAELKSQMAMQRSIPLESRQDGGLISTKGIKQTVPYMINRTLVKFDIDNISDFFLLTNGEENENPLTLFLKLVICIMVEILLWNFDFTDPFNSRQAALSIWVCNLLIVLFFAAACKNIYTGQWVNQPGRGIAPFKFISGYDNVIYIVLAWLLRMVVSFYRKGVKTNQELELVI